VHGISLTTQLVVCPATLVQVLLLHFPTSTHVGHRQSESHEQNPQHDAPHGCNGKSEHVSVMMSVKTLES